MFVLPLCVRPSEASDHKKPYPTQLSHYHFLIRVISEFVEVYDLGRVFQSEFQMKLVREKRGREPDLFFVAKPRLSQLQPGFFDGPGDLVIEIISPESISRDTLDKFVEYQSGGVPEFWLIDPPNQPIRYFHLDPRGRFQPAFANVDNVSVIW